MVVRNYSEKSFRSLSEGILQGSFTKDVSSRLQGEDLYKGICRAKNKKCEPCYVSKENSLKNF